MNTLDTLYRAFIDMRKSTADDRDCALQRTALTRADADNDVVETIRHTLHIEEDWVQAIQDGLVFVEKAIAEERQFIRNNGEVVPIEKVRRVSRDSVEHLAKHSDLITTAPEEGEDLIPDELYTVERLSDYAVYENRFLYMLLCYLQQFIAIRYDNIVDLANTYRGSLSMDKTIKSGKQNLTFKIELKEERRNDPLLAEINPNKSIIERIGMLGKMVAHYLNTPLMQEVKKAPMLHPPITVTNVLRMNHNFRGAMKLYEFVSSYDKPGYSSEREDKRINPLPDLISDEFGEVEALASYLTYQYGMGVKDVLKERYRRDEEEKKRLADIKHKEQLKALRKRIAESGGDAEEYMLMLEKRNRALEADSAELAEAKKEIIKLEDEVKALNDKVTELNARDAERLAEIGRMRQEHEQTVATLTAEKEQALADLAAKHDAYTAELNAEFERHVQQMREDNINELSAIRASCGDEMARYREQCNETVEQFKAAHGAQIEERDRRIAELEGGYEKNAADARESVRLAKEECDRLVAESKASEEKMHKKFDDIVQENKLLSELKTLADARANALRYKAGIISEKDLDNYTSELAFNEIENQYRVFTEFFKKSWKKTKKKIRAAVAEQVKNESAAKDKKPASQGTQETSPQTQAQQTEKENATQTEPVATENAQPVHKDTDDINNAQ